MAEANHDTATQAQVDEMLAQLTLEEKAALTVGRDFWTTTPVERLGIPALWLSDGPTGVRKAPTSAEPGLGTSLPATCFPTASAMAASWDVALAAEVGRALGVESQALGVHVLLGPGVNLKRSPLCGRNFEYFSEDPVLSGEMAAAVIGGVQEQGVGTSLKHFVANENETGRMYVDSLVDERTLRELYLRPFEIAVAKANPWTIMCAYNRLNGESCAEHRRLLHDILKEEWGYDGIVMSDWLAVNDRVAGVEAGLHLQMPGAPTAASVVAAVEGGRLAEARLDAIVRELLALILKAEAARRPDTTFDADAHHALARRAAGAGIVLLKNEGDLLPLAGQGEIALIGAFAKTPRYQGAGSSQVVPTRVTNAHDALSELVGDGATITYAAGYTRADAPDPALIEEAKEIAARAQVAVVFVGLPLAYESEGADRPHLDLPPAHNALVEAVLAAQPNTVVVLTNGTAVAMPWADRAPAIVEGWLVGQAGGEAVADVLLGRVNPSGKLGETFPVRLADTPAYLSFPTDGEGRAPFSEGLFTGYRWYDARGIAPLFPFGHGLSYTTFAYADLAVDKFALRDTDTLAVSLTVRNSGDIAGQEVVQLYVREKAPRLPRPDKELKAFAKVALEPGASQEVHFTLDERDFAFYDSRAGAWAVTSGAFEILVGASAGDIRLTTEVTLESTRPLTRPLDRLSPLRECLAHPTGAALVQPVVEAMAASFGGGEIPVPAPEAEEETMSMELFLLDIPLGKLAVMGALSEHDLTELIAAANASTTEGGQGT